MPFAVLDTTLSDEAKMEPFTPRGASIFNRFAADDLLNSFLGGAFVLLILTYLTSILNSLLYPTRSLRKRSIDRYIIFSRISSMRGLFSLFKGIELSNNFMSTAPSSCVSVINHTDPTKTNRDPEVRRKYTKLFAPCFVRVLLLAAEFAAIYAGTSVSRFAISTEGFDVAVLPPTSPLNLQTNSTTGCDDFLREARGQEQAGELLSCVFRTVTRMPAIQRQENASISLTFIPSQNSLAFQIRNAEHKVTRIEFQTILNAVDGESVRLSPVRPDLSPLKGNALFDAIIDGLLYEWRLPNDGFRNTTEGLNAIIMLHSQEIPLTQSEIADHLVAYLRALPLSLNSTGPPWVFSDGQFKQRPDIRVAIIGVNRVAHSILLTVVLVLAVMHLTVQHFFPGFDSVAYAAIKSLRGEALGIGPTATAEISN